MTDRFTPQVTLSASGTYSLIPVGVPYGRDGYQLRVQGAGWTGSLVLVENQAPPGSAANYVNVAYQNANTRLQVAAGTAITADGTFIVPVRGYDVAVQYTHTAGSVTLSVSPAHAINAQEAANVGLTRVGSGTFERSVRDKLGEQPSVTDFGAVGDGTTDDYAALARAATALGATNRLYFPPGTYRVGTNLTVNCECIFALGATLEPDSGVTVTLAGPVTTAPGASIIASTAAGTVSITGPTNGSGVLDVRTFGAVGDGTTDDTAAIQRALDAVQDGDTLLFPPGTYLSDKVAVTKSGTVLACGATFALSGDALFCVTAPLASFAIRGAAFTMSGVTGTSGREAFVNASTVASATLADFGENLTVYASFATVNEVGRLEFVDCAFGACKVTVAGTTTQPITDRCTWEHGSTVNTAPYYLMYADTTFPVLRNSRFAVYPPDGENKDIVKVANVDQGAGDAATQALIEGNRFQSLNPACTCAQVDTYSGGRMLGLLNNTFVNVQAHVKAWGAVDGGFDFAALRIHGNNFVRQSGFSMLFDVEACLYLLATRASVVGNTFVDESPGSASLTCVNLAQTTGSVDFDDLAVPHAVAVAVSGNVATFVAGNQAGVFARYQNADAAAPVGDFSFANNVMNGGSGWFRTASLSTPPTNTTWTGNVWNDPSAAEALQVGQPSIATGNVWPAVVSDWLDQYSVTLASGNNNDLAIPSWVKTLRLTANAANSTLTGIAAPAETPRRLRVVNVGSSGSVLLTNQDAASNVSNRFRVDRGGNVGLQPEASVVIEYDEAVAKWRVVAGGIVTLGVSGDRGDAGVTLVPGAFDLVQRFNTTLTADRAVALSTTGAWEGLTWTIVRPAGGAFNLNVGTGPLKAMPAGSWAQFTYDGSAFFLSAYGTL